MKSILTFLLVALFLLQGCTESAKEKNINEELLVALDEAATNGILKNWYPLVLDMEDGGYYGDITSDFKVGETHDKMIVSQARHIWTTATAYKLKKDSVYLSYATHGYKYLRDVFWDKENGGFHNLINKKGTPIFKLGEEKTAYGNSFGIYALATYYDASKNEEALELAKETFDWLEKHSHDTIYKGYYQSLKLNGTPIIRDETFLSTAEAGYKDQNSSIHLLEAFTALYKVWPNELLAERIEELLLLISNVITTDKGYMNLFFEKDWTPLTFVNETKEVISKHYYLDHVSFGHDVETAYLMLEASEAIGGKHTPVILEKGKKMVDHALRNGWDKEVGGFYDGGYYFSGTYECVIVNDEKNWWSQAEGLNSLLIMSNYYPNDEIDYRGYFDTLWDYINTYIIDDKNGAWYEWGADKQPETKEGRKGHIWKATYHNYRALINCQEHLEKMESLK